MAQTTLKILGIAGSLRKGSYNRALLRAAQSMAPAGMAIDIFELAGIPVFNQDEEQSPPAAVMELRRRVKEADGVLFCTPEHNFSVPAALKNAIDWVSRPPAENAWAGKPAAIMGASGGMSGTMRAQLHLRQIFVNLDVRPMNKPSVMISFSAQHFDAQGSIVDQETRDKIRQVLEAFMTWVRQLPTA